MAEKLISQRKLSQLSGVPRATLQRWTEAGHLRATPAGQYPIEAVAQAQGLRTGLEERSAPQAKAAKKKPPATAPERPPAGAGKARDEIDALDEAGLKLRLRQATVRLKEAQADQTGLAAELKELRLAHERGDFVRRVEVERNAREGAEAIRDQLRAAPARVAPLILALLGRPTPPRAAEVEELVATEINAALIALQGDRYVGAAE